MTTTLTCDVCAARFTPSDKLLALFQDKGWGLPRRCDSCHKAGRKLEPDTPKPAWPIVCSRCQAPDTVSFKPRSQEGLLCRNCFKEQRGKFNKESAS